MQSQNQKILIIPHNSELYWKAVDLRTKILRVPLGLQFTREELLQENDQIHFVMLENDRVIATLALKPVSETHMKMRQVAVDDAVQKSGKGKMLVLFSEEYARSKGFTFMECHARKAVAPFYLKLGYVIEGDEFTEVTIPHYRMVKPLK